MSSLWGFVKPGVIGAGALLAVVAGGASFYAVIVGMASGEWGLMLAGLLVFGLVVSCAYAAFERWDNDVR